MHSTGDVRSKADDELETIDGDPVPEGAGPVAAPGVACDYPELVTVERRHYAISGEIAKGGMGRVLAARDLRLGRAVAIKELLPRNRDLTRRFEREARITAKLQHPAIIHVYEAGCWSGGEPFYAMTHVSGRSLDKVVGELATLNERLSLLPNVIAVVDALAYAHNENVIHRDLKPANVLVGAFGETVVIDWGLAKDLGAPPDAKMSMLLRIQPAQGETNVGSIVGTPAYMPPEQARGASVDQRADVYALGALLYHVLVGKPPYVGSSKDVLEKVKTEPYTPLRGHEPGVPADLVAIVAKAMARGPDDRYCDAGELAQDLKRFQTGRLVSAHHYTSRQLLWRWLRRHRFAVVTSSLFVMVLMIVGALSLSTIVDDQRRLRIERATLLEDRGRSELLDHNDGKALTYLAGAKGDRGPRQFMLAEAARSFEAELPPISTGVGPAVIATSPSDDVIAAGGGTVVELYRLERNARTAHARGIAALPHTEHTHVIVFDAAGAQVATGGDDGTLRIWTAKGDLVGTFGGHGAPILDATFSPDGKLVATGSADGDTRVWTLADRRSVECRDLKNDGKTEPCHRKAVVSVRFSPDGTRVASASADYRVSVWDAAAGEMIAPLRHDGAVNSVRWSRDGSHLVTASDDGTAGIWIAPQDDAESKKGKPWCRPLRRPGGDEVTSAEFSSDGKRVLTASADGVARLWILPELGPDGDMRTAATMGMELVGHSAEIDHAVWSRDDALIATAGRDFTAKLWDAHTGLVIGSFEHADVVGAVAFHRDQTHLVTASADGSARIWDISKHVQLRALEMSAPVHAIAVNGGPRSGDETIAVGLENSRVMLLRGAGQTKLVDHIGSVFAAAFSPDGSMLVTGGADDDNGAILWRGDRVFRRLGPHLGPIQAVAFSTNGSRVATAGDDGWLRLWSTSTGSLVLALPGSTPIVSLAISSRDDIATLDAAGQFVVWNKLGVPIHGGHRTVSASRRAGSISRGIAFSHDGTRLAVAGASSVAVYAVGTPRPLRRIDGAFKDVRAVVFSLDDTRVITGGGEAVRVWDVTTGKLLGIRYAPDVFIETLALSADGDAIWAGGAAGVAGAIRAWDIGVERRPAAELAQLVDDLVPWSLSDEGVVTLKSERGGGDGQR